MNVFLRDIEDYYKSKQSKIKKKRNRKGGKIRPVNWLVWEKELDFKARLLDNFKNSRSVLTPGIEKYIDLSKCVNVNNN